MSRCRRARSVYNRDGSATRYIDDVIVTEEEFQAAFPDKEPGVALPAATKSCWPMKSEALAVHPDQVGEANAMLKKAKIAAEYDGEGFCHISSRAARKELLKLEGFFDKKGGYGD